MVKNLPVNTEDIRDAGLNSGSGRSLGGGHGNPLQYSYLENSMDRGDWWATAYGVTKSWTLLKRLSTHDICMLHTNIYFFLSLFLLVNKYLLYP